MNFISQDLGDDKKYIENNSHTYLNPIFWEMKHEREKILDLLFELENNVVHANSIFITNMSEYYVRRNYMNRAIGDCETIIQECQYIVDRFGLKISKYLQIAKWIEEQRKSIANWKKSDNQKKMKLKEKEDE